MTQYRQHPPGRRWYLTPTTEGLAVPEPVIPPALRGRCIAPRSARHGGTYIPCNAPLPPGRSANRRFCRTACRVRWAAFRKLHASEATE